MSYRGAIACLLAACQAVLVTALARAEFVGSGEYIEPMVKVSWNQRTPWNFYLPVLGNDARDGGYVGCVGTMLSQLLTVHQWPARLEVPLDRSLKLEYASPISEGYRERMSFNDEVPMPWAEAAAVKSPATYRAKHAAARVCLFVDLLTDMKFLQTGADSTIGNCMNPDQTPYYEVDEVLNVATFTAEQLAEKIYPSLAKGCPVGVEIMYENRMGHAVIIDGWDARDPSAVPKIHLNYGWQGLYDGWYELLQTPDTLRNLSLGFRPKPRAQFAPLPNRTTGSASLAWDFPAYWAERGLSGWTLACESSAGQNPQTLTDPFTQLLDPVAALDTQNERKPLFAVGRITDGSHDATNGSAEANYLLVTTVLDVHAKTYTWPQLFVPEAASTLTFRAQSCYARNEALVLELRAGNAPWRVIHTFTSADETKGAEEAISLPLGDYANRPCQLRLRLQRTHVSGTEAVFENQVAYRLRDWQISQATPLVAAGEVTVSDPAARTYTASGLTAGTAYAWRITPRFADASPEGLASAPVSTLAASTGAALPEILSVTSPAGTALDEECRRACAPAGRTTLRVKLSAGATPLAPRCQNRDLLSEEDFSITSRGNDTYDLSFTMAGKSAKAISAYTSNAALLTLRATDADGNLAARDVMLQFVAGTASDPNPETGEVDPGDTPEEGGTGEPALGGDQSARQATEVLTAEGNLLRFAPGLTYAEGKWSGWVDNSQIGNSTTAFAWASPAANALAWWLANYRKQGGTLSPGTAEAAYIGESATSTGGYDSPVADVFVDCWTTAANDYQPLYALQWLFDGTYLAMSGDYPALKSTATLPTGLVRSAIASTLIPDLKVYIGESSSSYTALGTDQAAITQAFSDYLLDNLTHGPIMVATNTSYLTIWGVEAQQAGTAEAPAWLVKTVYATDPTNAPSALEALPYNGVYYAWGSYSPRLGEETLVYRTIPVYAYGHANGQASSGGTGGEDPDPEPEPDPTPGETPDPAADPVIPDEDLGGHYPYEIHRSYWIARWAAIRQGKLLFVLSGADWCSWCSRVKDYLKTIPDFEKDFVVYFASRDSYDYSPYFSGGLPQYGTADPRQANPFAGVAQSDGSMAWSNAWTAAGSGLLYARRGYDEASISAAVSTARAAYPGGIQVGNVESPALTIKGPTHVLAGSPTAYTLAVTFPDSVEMALDHRVKWEVLSGNATLTEAGVLTASAPGAITLRATNFHDFPGTSAELAVTALEASAITALDIPVDTLNLALDATPQLPCLATFSDGTQAAILPSTWSVAYVENSFSSLPNFGTGYTPEPKLAADGTLSYINPSVANHKLSVTAAMAGGPSVTREVTVYGPRQMIPSQVTLLSNQRVSAGSVVRLKVSELSYNDGTEVKTTGETALANYYLTVNEGYTSVAASRTPDWTIALGPSFATAPSGTTLSAKVAASAQNSAYTSYEAWPNLTHALTYIPAGEVVEQGKYGNVPSGWLEAYFPGTEHTAAQAQEDSDGDGYANWEEFILGTEPDQAADAFAFTSQHFSAMVSDATINLYYKVMYTLRSGREYTLQAKVNWSDPWQDVGIIDADKRTQPEVLNQPLADSANFFRVSVRFSKESGSYTYTEEAVIPNGLAITPGAVLELDGAQPLALTALAMDDYAPGNPLIRLPEGLDPGTVILSAPANCDRWMACFRPADSAVYAFEVTPSADGKRLELRTASPFNPQPKPPAGDSGTFREDIKAQLAEAARAAGFTQDFTLQMRERGGSFAEPSVERVNGVMDCFSGLALEPNAAENTLTIHYNFGIDSMAFVTLEGTPCVVFGAKVTSQLPGSAEPSQADFAEGTTLALLRCANLGEESTQAEVVEVTDPSGTTAGQCSAPGQRYFRYTLPKTASTHFFTLRISR